MSKLLVRILIGLVTVITVLGLFSFTVLKLSNIVRVEHFWTDVVTPPVTYLTSENNNQLIDKQTSLSLIPIKGAGISEVDSARLEAGQVVLDLQDNHLNAMFLYQNDKILLLESDPDGRAVYELYLDLIRNALNTSLLSNTLNNTKDEIALQFGVSIESVRDEKRLHSQALLESIDKTGIYLLKTNSNMVGVVRLNDGQLLDVTFCDHYSPISLSVFVFLFCFNLAALTLCGYLLIQMQVRRLRTIETAASRISRGELDARVTNAGDEDSISRLGASFNAMADHIERLMNVQKEMIHAVSHELRTPVARIRFGVQMIADCPNEAALQKQVSGIDGDIQELDELIDEILTYARLEQGGPILAFQESDVSAIVEQVVSEQGSVKPDMQISAEFKDDSDQWKLSEVEAKYIHRSIQNLVGNATRYAKSKVLVVCSFDSETCRVDVEDDGPGIPESDWESVFTPFARLDDSRTRSSGGYGLGLSIVRRILYWHGGQAFLGRSSMGGAKFSLVWPRKQTKL